MSSRVSSRGPREGAPLTASHGARYMVAAAFCFSLMSLLVKLVGQSMPSQEIVLVRGLITVVIAYAAIRRMVGLDFRGHRRGLLALRGVLGFAAVSCFFYAVVHLPLADVTVIHYTNPAFTAAIAAVVLAEPVRARDAASLVASLAGVVLIARPSFLFEGASRLDPVAAGAGLLGAILSAGAYVTVRELRHTEHPMVIVLWFALVTTAGSVPGTIPGFVMPRGWQWLALAGVGITTHVGQVLLTHGLAAETAGRAMTVGYVQIVFAAVWGALFFGEHPDAWTLIGAALIVASTLAVARRTRPGAP